MQVPVVTGPSIDGSSLEKMRDQSATNWLTVLFIAVMLFGGVVLAYRSLFVRRDLELSTKLVSGVHVAFVFVAPSGPPTPDLVRAVRNMRTTLQREAVQTGVQFTTIGVSDDWDIERGWEQLREVDVFDEVSVGRNRFNLGVQTFITNVDGSPIFPQVVVTRDSVAIEQAEPLRARTVVVRLLGTEAILAWRPAKRAGT